MHNADVTRSYLPSTISRSVTCDGSEPGAIYGSVFLKPDYDGVDRSGFNDREEQVEEELCDSSVPASSLRRKKMSELTDSLDYGTSAFAVVSACIYYRTFRFAALDLDGVTLRNSNRSASFLIGRTTRRNNSLLFVCCPLSV